MTASAPVASVETSSSPTLPAWRESRREPVVRFRDNPLTQAFARRALRPTNVWPGALVVAILGALVVWGCVDMPLVDREIIYRFALGFFAVPLVLVAPLSIASSVGHDRANGLLDFHRSSPTTALSNVVGYIAGNGARWALFSAIGLPFTIAISILAHNPIVSTLTAIAMIVGYAVFYASIAAMAGALVNASRVLRAGLGAAVPVALLFASAVGVAIGESHRNIEPLFIGTLSPLVAILPGVSMAAQADAALIICVGTVFALRIAERRFSREDTVPFSRPDAFAFVVATMALHALHERLVPARIDGLFSPDTWTVSLSATLTVAVATVVASTLSLMPRRSHLVAWARRAGGDPLAPIASASANQGASIVPATFAFGLIAAGMSIAAIGSLEALRTMFAMWNAIGAVVLLPVIFVAAMENSALRHPRNVGGWTILSLVMVLLLPLGIAGLAAITEVREPGSQAIASLSPLYLPFVGFSTHGVPAVSWIASVAAIAFFVARARSARRALVARLSVAGKP